MSREALGVHQRRRTDAIAEVPWSRKDLFKLAWLICGGILIGLCFLSVPGLFGPVCFSLMVASVLNPVVSWFERKGMSRNWAVLAVLATVGIIATVFWYWVLKWAAEEWVFFKGQLPSTKEAIVQKIEQIEKLWVSQYAFLKTLKISAHFKEWLIATESGLVSTGTGIVGSVFNSLLIVPLLTLVLLREGTEFKHELFNMVPGRIFESVFLITHKSVRALGSYLRAKVFEAALVGGLSYLGLWITHTKYALFFSVIAGLTNVIPYFGPLIGVITPIVVSLVDPEVYQQIWPILGILGVANLIDLFFIFPVLVAQLIDLHPFLLIVAVLLGQSHYGLIGMLVSVPIASALKVVTSEIYQALYRA